MTEVDKAEAGTQREEGSFGRKLALGIFASKTDEYLQRTSHNATGAEGVVFKVKKKTGAGMAEDRVLVWKGQAVADRAGAAAAPERAAAASVAQGRQASHDRPRLLYTVTGLRGLPGNGRGGLFVPA